MMSQEEKSDALYVVVWTCSVVLMVIGVVLVASWMNW